jgi:hypothetical protein
MNALELANELEKDINWIQDGLARKWIVDMLRQQQVEINQQNKEKKALYNLLVEQDKKIIDLAFKKVYAERTLEINQELYNPYAVPYGVIENADHSNLQPLKIIDTYKLQNNSQIDTYKYKELTDEEILTAIKSIADDVGSYKEYENTYEDGWLDACNTVYDEVFAILRKAQEK